MITCIVDIDTQFFLFLNGLHADWLDPVFYYISQIYTWIPLYLLVLFLIIKKWGKRSLIIIPLLILTIVCTDQSCNIIKRTVQRERPSHCSEISAETHLVSDTSGELYRGGHYGFPSAHAANSIAFVLFFIFFVAQKKKWLMASAILWSLLMAYSRIYLGVHYPLDILCGLILGCCWSLLGIWVFFRYGNKCFLKKE